jgi:hypothetical protein
VGECYELLVPTCDMWAGPEQPDRMPGFVAWRPWFARTVRPSGRCIRVQRPVPRGTHEGWGPAASSCASATLSLFLIEPAVPGLCLFLFCALGQPSECTSVGGL